MIVILEGHKMINRNTIHPYLKEKLDLPEYYGNNLDALWDVLSTYDKKLEIVLQEKDILIKNLGTYGESLIDLLIQASNENGNISFIVK
ncbi:MAG TPA: barstar family protein [Haloplasmataceae bacterium]